MNTFNSLIDELPIKYFARGEAIFLEGEVGEFAYIIQEGEVNITTKINGKDSLLTILYKDDMFGELALIDNSPRSASAIAKTDVVTTIITGQYLQKIIESSEPILKLLLKSVMRYFRLENDRLNLYQYSQNLKMQMGIRQEAMEQAFGEIHNGPLQTLALLIRDIQEEKHLSELFFDRLKNLDNEIRKIGEKLTEEPEQENLKVSFLNTKLSSNLMRLGEGTILELTVPLHELFYNIFTVTIKRDFPYFQTIKIKVRDFQPYPNRIIDLALKREICFCLEEAICNVGKHAQGATKIIATSKVIDDLYLVQVENNGVGLRSKNENKGTKLFQHLTKKINGNFTRKSLPNGGVIWAISWKIQNRI